MRPTGQKKNEPLRCVFLVLLSVTDMSKYTRLTEESFSALISCVIGPGRAAPSPAAERARRAAARARNARRRASGAALWAAPPRRQARLTMGEQPLELGRGKRQKGKSAKLASAQKEEGATEEATDHALADVAAMCTSAADMRGLVVDLMRERGPDRNEPRAPVPRPAILPGLNPRRN